MPMYNHISGPVWAPKPITTSPLSPLAPLISSDSIIDLVPDVVKSGARAVKTGIDEANRKEKENEDFKNRSFGTLGKTLTFPEELSGLNRPILEIRCLQKHSIIDSGTSVYLPAPGGLSYSNSSTYNDSQLGIIGNAALGALGKIDGITDAGGFLAGVSQASTDLFNTAIKTDLKSGILALAETKFSDPKAKATAGIAAAARFNPYVVTSFDGTNTREYNFVYKLIPSSREEADIIKKISRLFQIAVYGEVEGFLLKYPPKWQLTILSGDKKGLKPISSFHECYLSDCSVTYNESNNSYFDDDSPFETDISLTFKETKALHANEIAKLLLE
jgi:hypothetical protein